MAKEKTHFKSKKCQIAGSTRVWNISLSLSLSLSLIPRKDAPRMSSSGTRCELSCCLKKQNPGCIEERLKIERKR
jgi:hypothetical protein